MLVMVGGTAVQIERQILLDLNAYFECNNRTPLSEEYK